MHCDAVQRWLIVAGELRELKCQATGVADPESVCEADSFHS